MYSLFSENCPPVSAGKCRRRMCLCCMKNYRNIFIDLDDTVWDFTGNSRIVYRTLYDKFGYSRFFESFEQYIAIFERKNEELWAAYGMGDITKEELNIRRFSYPLTVAGADRPDLAGEYMNEALAMMPTMKGLVDGAYELLTYLRGKYRLYVLSNGFRELQYRKMESAGISEFFDRVILSEDIKVHKPNAAIFHFALSATQSSFEDSVMLGDNIETDIRGAMNAGIDQIYFNRWGLEHLPFRPTFTVSSLTEVKKIL